MTLGAVRVFATVLVSLDVELRAQDTGLHEWADVESHTVVEVRRPADRLFCEGLPPNVNVVGRLSRGDQIVALRASALYPVT